MATKKTTKKDEVRVEEQEIEVPAKHVAKFLELCDMTETPGEKNRGRYALWTFVHKIFPQFKDGEELHLTLTDPLHPKIGKGSVKRSLASLFGGSDD